SRAAWDRRGAVRGAGPGVAAAEDGGRGAVRGGVQAQAGGGVEARRAGRAGGAGSRPGWVGCQGWGMGARRAGPRSVRYAHAPARRQKQLGALPVVASLCRQLDLAGIIDRLCPVREVAIVSHGQVIEALVANRLTSPRPLLRVEEWGREWALA